MEKLYNISLNISNKTGVFPLFRVVQGDNITRKIVAALYDANGDTYTPGTGVTAEYWSQKPDRTGTSHSASLSGSTVTITLTEQDTAAVGDVYATVKLIKNEEVLSAIPFRFKVEAFPLGANIESTSDYQTLVDATEAAEQATEDAQAATTAAEAATEYATEAADTASNYNIDLLAEGYDATAIYVTGDYCIYQGALYRCLTDITTPEAWTASHWLAVELGADIQDAWRDATEGYSDTLTAGDLTSDEYAEDTEPYLFRRTFNGANNHAMDTLAGGTVAWNQLVENVIASTTWNGLTITNNADGSITIDGTSTNTSTGNLAISTNNLSVLTSHKYLAFFNNSTFNANLRISSSVVFIGAMNGGFIGTPASDATGKLTLRVPVSETYSNVKIYPQVFDLTQMFGSTIADAIYAMEQAESGSGVAWFRRYFPEDYYAYDSGTLKSVEAVAHRMVGKNLCDDSQATSVTLNGVKFTVNRNSDGSVESVIANGTASSNASFRFIPTQTLNYGGCILTGCPSNGSSTTYRIEYYDETALSATYDYGSGTTIPIATNGHTCRVVCAVRNGYTANNLVFRPMIRFADTSDTFEPHKQHTYKLSTLTLRGIPKLIDGKLTYDGDTYEPSGKVVRKYGVVDLGTLKWTYVSGENPYFRAVVVGAKKADSTSTAANVICPRYSTSSSSAFTDKQCAISAGTATNPYIYVKDSGYTDATTFATAMSGTYLVYELATPTTETASLYEPTQVVYADGTEEYISQNIVPVGHVTKYPVSIKAKIYELINTVAELQALVLENISNS